jgi:hypothetical protein
VSSENLVVHKAHALEHLKKSGKIPSDQCSLQKIKNQAKLVYVFKQPPHFDGGK